MKNRPLFIIFPFLALALLTSSISNSAGSEMKFTKTKHPQIPSSAKFNKSSAVEVINSAIKISSFVGDGSYFVSAGDTVKLDNNIQIKINSISKINPTSRFNKNELEIFASFFLNGSKLSIFPLRIKIYATPQNPAWKGYLFGGYAAQIALPDGNQQTEIETTSGPIPKFKLSFKSSDKMGVINSAAQLFNYCQSNLQEQYNKNQCFMFTPYEPVSGETKKADDTISVIGPANLVDAYFLEAKKCHERLSNLIGTKQDSPVIPIRIAANVTTQISSSDFGILLPTTLQTGNPDQCNTAMLHEMAHFFIAPAPLRDIFNEGLATYITSLTPEINNLTLTLDNFIVDTNWQAVIGAAAPVGFKILSLNQSNSTATLEYGLKINGTWTKINQQTLALGLGEAIVLNYDPYFPVIELKELAEQSAIFAIYEHLSPIKNSSTFICEENGFKDMLGWRAPDGKIIKAAASINPLIAFAKLDTYLNGGTSSANDYYKTSACLWEKIDKSIGIKKTVDEMRKWQNYKNEPFDFINFLSTNGMDINSMAQTFGFSTEDQAMNFVPFFLIGEYFVI